MTSTLLLIAMMVIMSASIGVLAHYFFTRNKVSAYKERLREYAKKSEQLSENYDHYRRKYLDLDDRYQEVKSMEQTYRVAYQEWKSKYEAIKEQAFEGGKRSLEIRSMTDAPQPQIEDQEDQKILFHVWKKKARQTAKDLDKLKLQNDLLKRKIEKMDVLAGENQVYQEKLDHLRAHFKKVSEQFLQEMKIDPAYPEMPQKPPTEVFNLD